VERRINKILEQYLIKEKKTNSWRKKSSMNNIKRGEKLKMKEYMK